MVNYQNLYSLENEMMLVGALIIAGVHNPTLIGETLAKVKPSDFHDSRYLAMYDAVGEVYERDGVVDTQLVIEYLQKTKKLDDAGGIESVVEAVESVATCEHASVYANRVLDYSFKRKLVAYCESAIERCESADEAKRIVLDLASDIQLIAGVYHHGGIERIGDAMQRLLADIEKSGEAVGKAIPTGYYELDHLLNGGFRQGEMVIIAARPSMGKTALALNIADNYAKGGTPTLVFSIEMTWRQLGIRTFSKHTGISQGDIMQNVLDDSDKSRLSKCVEELKEMPLFIDDNPSIYISTMRSTVRDAVERFDVGAVFVDYLQIMPMQESLMKKSRNEAVGYLSAQLKSIAREYSIPMVVLSQLSRSPSDSATNPPTLDRLRDSGSIEQDADVVMFVHRPGYYDKNLDQNVSQVIVAKHRNGPTGAVDLRWVGNLTKFDDMPAQYNAPGDDWTNN